MWAAITDLANGGVPEATILAIITGMAGIIAAVAGVCLTIRNAKTREQQSAKESLDRVESWLADERKKRIEAEFHIYQLALLLARHGIDQPPSPRELPRVTDEFDGQGLS